MFLLLLALAGCTTRISTPDLGSLYNRSAKYHGPDRNPVIVIPGIMGSRLVDPTDGTVVWGAFRGRALDPTKPEGARIAALPMERGIPLAELSDRLVVDGALDRVRLSLLYVPIELRERVSQRIMLLHISL